MARVSLIRPEDRPELSELVAKISGARGRLLNIYRVLLHSAPVTEAWLTFISTLRSDTSLDVQTLELAITRIGIVNRAEYILRQHVPNYVLKAGLTMDKIDTLPQWRESQAFSASERALLAYVDAMTREIDVDDATFGELRKHYNEQQVVELTVLVGAYNMHSRLVKALNIDLETPQT